MTRFEEQFIHEGGRNLEQEAFSRSLQAVKVIYGEDAYNKAVLSDKPLPGFIAVRDPRNELQAKLKLILL